MPTPVRSCVNLVFDKVTLLIPPKPKECLKVIRRHVDKQFTLLLATSDLQASMFRAEPNAELKGRTTCTPSSKSFPLGSTRRGRS